jgi:hypothetical protein
MTNVQLDLKPGKWLVANCGEMPSGSKCQLVMMAPENQKEDLLAAEIKHAIDKHGHQDSEVLRKGVEGMIQTIEVS